MTIFFFGTLCYTFPTVRQTSPFCYYKSPSHSGAAKRLVCASMHVKGSTLPWQVVCPDSRFSFMVEHRDAGTFWKEVYVMDLTIYQDNPMDVTIVPNLFIDEYMKEANDAQIKVYLYLLRMMHSQSSISVPGIADQFNHTEKDVLRSLKYWEKHRLLDLDYDGEKNLTGIHIRNIHPRQEPAPTGKAPETVPVTCQPDRPDAGKGLPDEFTPTQTLSPGASATRPALLKEDAHLSPADPSMASALPAFEKPVYSADQLRAFKERQDTAQLLFIAESYIGKPLTPSEIKTILYFTDVLHFSDDLIDYLLQYCVGKGKKDFKYIEKVAVNWATEGITTPKQARQYSSRYDKNVYIIMNELGKSGSPTGKEVEYITRWIKEYDFPMDVIFEACQRTVLATDKHRFEYAEGILSSWKSQNIHHKSDISKADDLYQKRRKSSSSQERMRQTGNRFNQFAQNAYDFDALEQELLSN